ncbi:hypothetical protein : Uncharacterized protein OS=Singulisphaera acidiphila (strain ATCC BAA-1392 / DSM 18658 / VKM B-2454 / MOB10) GN=Sinac_3697 PE=4 SV=1: DUF1501 [Gemmataceae bacterium]|nr:hypothetical protein : Uncharacterized protein OS=Singulisphaera acidiphila (strain ATCC BAA-1392 / DSM 18658 / VKM B-2454 / MOB10) GN=Sinac_3697 PE=4 SV=1: DUF1501 [Gemmataceae bacterium]VTU01754.1 hypothetical protein : Uncharacterized protein OS=Singulisphaera acidiphila (strain ATCC BAA-1392 / DSM 18658 / VKM B-2454 / MOB10) GN=Sinac_3697 PE=4 SV=1: DUF1501 [Gemmataceae bacterium]
MLTVPGPAARYCDGLSRRSFLRAGALGLGGLTLPGLMRAEAAAGKKTQKSVIMIYLSGGLAHQDTFDLKPNAPAEVRGEFAPIRTNVPGVQFGEHLPKLAKMMDKLIVLRSLVGQRDEHSSWQSYTATPMDIAKRENKPHFGSVVARLQGQTDPITPAFVDLSPTMQHKPYNSPGPGALGRAAAPVKVDGDEIAVMKNLAVTPAELQNRKALLENLDAFRRAAAAKQTNAVAADTFHDRAFDVLTSSKLVEALDVTREPEQVRNRYGRGSPKHMGDGAPMLNDQLLMARRLVEAGCRVVTVAYGFWDTHGQNFKHLKQHLPLFDTGISALIEDVYARGLGDDVTVCVWGEFGRTPKINKDAGRDHWSRVNSALLAGGGMRVGQVIGSTDSAAAEAKDEPIPYASVLATVYKNLGIDPHAMVYDVSNRPNPILPGGVLPIDKLH